MIIMPNWAPITFGKYKGRTLPEIAISDPDWFYRAYGAKLFAPPLNEHADFIGYQLDNIKPPGPDHDNWTFEYICSTDGDGKLLYIKLLRQSEAIFPTPMNTQIMQHFSFLWPRFWMGYDKSCSRLLASAFENYYFKDCAISRAGCEEFFSNSANFDWRGFEWWKAHPELPLMFR